LTTVFLVETDELSMANKILNFQLWLWLAFWILCELKAGDTNL